MMRYVLIFSCLLCVMKISVSAGGVKNILSKEQNKELCRKHVSMVVRGEEDGAKQQDRDSIRKAIETKYKPGTPSPDFKFKDADGKEFSLRDFRGKYVYIDVWATWCDPCREEIPYLQDLEKMMRGKKITFVSISWDRNRQSWLNMLKAEKLGGIQLHYGGDDTFLNEYGILYIPRFILLDKKGRVVNAFMTRPSDPKTEETLRNLKGI